jgi:hypothetical protein
MYGQTASNLLLTTTIFNVHLSTVKVQKNFNVYKLM